jgi:mercuric ion transport protein
MADKVEKPDGTDSLLLRMGVIGTVIVALCCFTPVLVVLLGVVGLSGLTGWLDVVLLPALAVFVGLTVYAVWRRRRRRRRRMKTT